MQTFLSEPTFEASARVLDNHWTAPRLRKQLLEVRQLFNSLAGNQKGFNNHPARNMWAGHEYWLLQYAGELMYEHIRRNEKYEENWNTILRIYDDAGWRETQGDWTPEPVWWTDPLQKDRLMWTHRANLYRKNPEWFADYYVDALTYNQMLAERPTGVVCCEKRRRIPGLKGLHPCQYWWPTHVEER